MVHERFFIPNDIRLPIPPTMKFELTIDDYAIILNALHYYKKVDKRGNFKQYDDERINQLRDKMAYQLIPSADSGNRL
jgi:hypothetical protein